MRAMREGACPRQAKPSPRGARTRTADAGVRPIDLLALYSATTLERFIDEAFRTLSRTVACAYVSVFYQRAGEGFLRERDSRGRVWGRPFMRRYVELTPAIPFVAANPGVKILPTRGVLAQSDAVLHRTAFYREVMRRQGWRHAVALCFWPDTPASFPILVLSVLRTDRDPDFSDQDLNVLEQVHPFLALAVTRFHQLSATNAVSEGIAATLRETPRGIVVLDWQLDVVRTNDAGRRSCADWNGTAARGRARPLKASTAVPRDLLNVCSELRQELQSVMRQNADSNARRRRHVVHPGTADLTASITAICQATAMAEPSFVIEFEGSKSSGIQPAEPASDLGRLTASEREVALAVATGVSNEEVAERLGKTIHAVKFLLHRIYAKLDVPNRSRLALRLRGGHVDS